MRQEIPTDGDVDFFGTEAAEKLGIPAKHIRNRFESFFLRTGFPLPLNVIRASGVCEAFRSLPAMIADTLACWP